MSPETRFRRPSSVLIALILAILAKFGNERKCMSRSAELLKAYEALGYKDFKTQFKRLIEVLNDNDFEYCIVGGLAYNEYAPKPRATQDLDLLVISDEDEVMEVLSEEFDFREVGAGQYQMTAAKGGGRLKTYDLLFNIGFDPYASAVNRAKKRNMFGIQVPVAQPLDLALMWLVAAPQKLQSQTDFVTYMQAGLVDKEKLLREIKVSDPALGMSKTYAKIYDGYLAEGKSLTWGEVQEDLQKKLGIDKEEFKRAQKNKRNYQKPSSDKPVPGQTAEMASGTVSEKLRRPVLN